MFLNKVLSVNDFSSAIAGLREIYNEKAQVSERIVCLCMVPHKYLRIVLAELPSAEELRAKQESSKQSVEIIKSFAKKHEDTVSRMVLAKSEINNLLSGLGQLNRQQVKDKLNDINIILGGLGE